MQILGLAAGEVNAALETCSGRYILIYMTTLTSVWNTILLTVQHMGYFPFAVLVIVNIILYRVHPVLGILGTLFLFAILAGFIH